MAQTWNCSRKFDNFRVTKEPHQHTNAEFIHCGQLTPLLTSVKVESASSEPCRLGHLMLVASICCSLRWEGYKFNVPVTIHGWYWVWGSFHLGTTHKHTDRHGYAYRYIAYDVHYHSLTVCKGCTPGNTNHHRQRRRWSEDISEAGKLADLFYLLNPQLDTMQIRTYNSKTHNSKHANCKTSRQSTNRWHRQMEKCSTRRQHFFWRTHLMTATTTVHCDRRRTGYIQKITETRVSENDSESNTKINTTIMG